MSDRVAEFDSKLPVAMLVELIRQDRDQRWQQGARIWCERYLARYPRLWEDRQQVLYLVYTEYMLRQELGEDPPTAEYFERFPDLIEALTPLFEVHQVIESDHAAWTEGPERLADLDPQPAGSRGSPRPDASGSANDRRTLYEQFELAEVLGRGGTAIVYRARHKELGREVALKLITNEALEQEEELNRLRAEAEVVARLNHPRIVQIYEVGEHEGQPYLVLELVDGGTLADRLKAGARPAREAAALVEKLATAIDAAHRHGVIHRDLKPTNILLSKGGTPKITDFGLAKWLDKDCGHTRTGSILGTPAYMAPEQAQGWTKQIGPATDVYSLGAILYELLTGRAPLTGETSLEILLKVAGTEPDPPSQLVRGLPPDLEAICLKCLAKSPAQRYASAEKLATDLRRFLKGEPTQARPPTRIGKMLRRLKRHSVLTFAIAILGLSVAGFIGGMLWHNHRLGQELMANDKLRREIEARELAFLRDQYITDMGAIQKAWQERRYAFAVELHARYGTEPHRAPLRDFAWEYLDRLLHRQQRTLTGHGGAIHDVEVSPDGKWIVTAGQDGKVRVWPSGEGSAVAVFEGHRGNVNAVAISPDSRWFVSAADDGQLRFWDLARQALVRIVDAHRGDVLAVAISPDGQRIATGGVDTWVRVWDSRTGAMVASLAGHQHWIRGLDFSPDGTLLASASSDCTVRLWEQENFQLAGTLTGHRDWVLGVDFSPDGKLLASCGKDQTIRVWDHQQGRQLVERKQPFGDAWVRSVRFSPSGEYLASAEDDGVVELWRTTDWDRVNPARAYHLEAVTALAFSPAGQLWTAGKDGTAKQWDVDADPQWEQVLSLPAPEVIPEGWHVNMAVAPACLALATEEWVRVWDLAQRKLRFESHALQEVFDQIAFSASGRWLACCTNNGRVHVWDTLAQRRVHTLDCQNESYHGVIFCPDERSLITGEGSSIRLWDVASGRCEQEFVLARPLAGKLAFAISPDGNLLAVRNLNSRCVVICDLRTRRERYRLENTVNATACFSPDGKRLATFGSDTSMLRVWEVATGRHLKTLARPNRSAEWVAFSPDGKLLATCGEEEHLELWDFQTGRQVLRIRAPVAENGGLVLDPTARRLMACSLLRGPQARIQVVAW